MPVNAVIFDMDGLLIDSERYGQLVLHEMGEKLGCPFSPELTQQLIGMTYEGAGEKLRAVYPALDTAALFDAFKEELHRRAAAGLIPMKKGAQELLAELQARGIPRAVASSSGPETISLYLHSVGIAEEFQALISGRDLPSKPAPDVFLRAAERLAVAPGRCLVLEDSYNGVKAGRAAGMQVCMVPDLLPYREELAPFVDFVMPDLGKVMELLKCNSEPCEK